MRPELIFFALVFVSVVLLSQMLFVSVYNPQRADSRTLKRQLAELSRDKQAEHGMLLLNNRLNNLSSVRAALESISWIKETTYKLELGGSRMLGHEYLLLALSITLLTTMGAWALTQSLPVCLTLMLSLVMMFKFRLGRQIDRRLEQIEAQFPEALDVMKRGLQAGYAFNDALKLVCEELQGELSKEMSYLFHRINFGADLKTALLYFIHRVPSTSAIAFASAVNIQKETGGNLAENIENLSKIIRQRFSFKRRIRTLSAEGRLSGWILVLLPFALFALLYITSPRYVMELLLTPNGQQLLQWGLIGMLLGVAWVRKLLQIEV